MDFFTCRFSPDRVSFWVLMYPRKLYAAETLSVSPERKLFALVLSEEEEKGHKALSGRQSVTKRHSSPYPDVRELPKSHLLLRGARLTDSDRGIAILDARLFWMKMETSSGGIGS